VAVSIDTTFLRRCIASLERAVEGTPWFASNRQADRLHFKDLFRHAARHDLMPTGAVERWLRYRDNRSFTAHDYGEDFAEATLKLLPTFIGDAKALADIIERPDDA